jgi:hypothetical protein
MIMDMDDVQAIYQQAIVDFVPTSPMAEGSKLWKQESHVAGLAAVAAAAWTEGQEAMARGILRPAGEEGLKWVEPNPFSVNV